MRMMRNIIYPTFRKAGPLELVDVVPTITSAIAVMTAKCIARWKGAVV
jgi:hypothetical protein